MLTAQHLSNGLISIYARCQTEPKKASVAYLNGSTLQLHSNQCREKELLSAMGTRLV